MNSDVPNKNRELIDGLRQAADFLEARPDFPKLGKQCLRLYVFARDAKPILKEAARLFGAFEKRFTNNYFELRRTINATVEIEVFTDRDAVCKKIVTWECSDDESLLKLIEQAEGE